MCLAVLKCSIHFNLICVAEYISPLSSGVMLLKHLLCPKISFPCGDDSISSKCFRKGCCYGACAQCQDFLKSNLCILNCPALFDNELIYRWKEYKIHTLDNGKKIKELRAVTSTVNEFSIAFVNMFERYRKHYFIYSWLNLCRRLDMKRLGPHELFIQTYYSAQPVLESQDKLNSVGHGVCVLSCWVVLHSPCQMYYVNKEGENVEYMYYECDHIRVVTPSTGKQKDQDWFLHCKAFDYIIKMYTEQLGQIKKVIVWTDGAPTQYKCRQNFYWISQTFSTNNVQVIHRFGATAQFKGVHDKIGQVAKWIVR